MDMNKAHDTDWPVARHAALNRVLKLKRGWTQYIQRKSYGICPLACQKKEHPVGWVTVEDARAFGDWALCWDSALFLQDQLHLRQPKTIVEFGSGASTLLFARYAQESHEDVTVISVEHDPVFLAKTQEKLIAQGLADRVVFLLSELQPLATLSDIPALPGWLAEQETAWYRLDHTKLEASLTSKVDLLFVDGPPAGHSSRWPAFPVFQRYLALGATVLMDDVRRPEEYRVFQHWLTGLQADIMEAGLVARGQGMALLRLAGDSPTTREDAS